MRYVEFGSFPADYSEGDVLMLDHVKDLSPLYPQKPKTILMALCCQGWQKLLANGQNIEMAVGDVLICPPSVKVEGKEFGDSFECKVLYVADYIIQGLLHDRMDVWHHAMYVNKFNIVHTSEVCKEELGFYYALIKSKLMNSQQSPSFEIIQALLRAMLLELCNALESANELKKEHKLSQGKVLFNRFLNLISNSEVKRQPIQHYASLLAITPKYLTMLCLKYSNRTASDWVVQYTLEDIRFYLRNTDLSIKEITAKLGFSNMSHFGSYVRKHLGASPSAFRFGEKG